MRDVIPYKFYSTNEIYQQKEVRFAFGRENEDTTITQCHTFVRCRDFLNDVIVESNYPGSISYPIYDFSYDAKKYPISKDKTILLVKAPKYFEFILKGTSLINEFEEKAGWNLTTIEEGFDDKEKILVVTGPPEWMQATYLISLYSMLIRILSYGYDGLSAEEYLKKVSEGKDNDSGYIRTIMERKIDIFSLVTNSEHILKGSNMIGEKEGEEIVPAKTYNTHNNSGVQSLTREIERGEEDYTTCVQWAENYKSL
jgi:hypothetical protein